ncbi:unnamed protein product, partial [Brassica rapa]
ISFNYNKINDLPTTKSRTIFNSKNPSSFSSTTIEELNLISFFKAGDTYICRHLFCPPLVCFSPVSCSCFCSMHWFS